MNHQKNKYGNNSWMKAVKYLLLSVGIILLVSAGLRLMLKSGMVHRYVKGIIEDQVETRIKGRLTIEGISGDLGNRFYIHNLLLTHHNDTLGTIDSVVVDITLPSILGRHFLVNELIVKRPSFFVAEKDSGRWNWSDLLLEDSSPTSQQEATSSFPFQITSAQIENGRLTVQSNFGIGKKIMITGVEAEGFFRQDLSGFEARLYSLNMAFSNDPVESGTVAASGSFSNQSVTLNQLLISTGTSLLEASAQYNNSDSSISSRLSFDPLSWQNIGAYTTSNALKKDISSSIQLKGTWPELTLTINSRAEGLDSLRWQTNFRYDSLLTIQQTDLTLQGVNLTELTGFEESASFGIVQISGEGKIDFQQRQHSHFNARWLAQKIKMSDFQLDSLRGFAELSENLLKGGLDAYRQSEKWSMTFKTDHKNLSQADWQLDLKAQNVNAGYWLQTPDISTRFTVQGRINGKGFSLSDSLWPYQLTIANGVFNKQQIRRIMARGTINRKAVSTRGEVLIKNSKLDFSGKIIDYTSEIPAYSVSARTGNLDVSELIWLESFPTNIKARIRADGKGFALADMQMQSNIEADTSLINGEYLYNFSTAITLSDSVLHVDDLSLASTFVNAQLHARQNLFRYYDRQNEFQFKAKLLDLAPLAPLMHLQKLEAFGSVSGVVKPNDNNTLQLSGHLDVTDVNVNDFVKVRQIKSQINGVLNQQPQFTINAGLDKPAIDGYFLKNMALLIEARQLENKMEGDFYLSTSSSDERFTEQTGHFTTTLDSLALFTETLMLKGPEETFHLQNPFLAEITADGFKMDTLHIASGKKQLVAAVPAFSEHRIELSADVRHLNINNMQKALLRDSSLGGELNTSLYFFQEGDSVHANVDGTVTNFQYPGVVNLDTVRLKLGIADKQLNGRLEIFKNRSLLATGHLQVPFRMADPETLGRDFFEQEVEGGLVVKRTNLKEFGELMDALELGETSGFFSYKGSMKGTAGNPRLSGSARLDNAVVSGVALDSVLVNIGYDHDRQQLHLDSKVNSAGQQLALVNADLPFAIDLRHFTVLPPGMQDSIGVTINTNNFDLTALNDFVDSRLLRKIEGRINGTVFITGTPEVPKASGSISLRGGRLNVVPAGMTYDKISGTLLFAGEELQFSKFIMHGGSGTITANGSVRLNQLMPDAANITIKANTFKLANTNDLSLNISANARLTGSLLKPVVKGNLAINNGFYYLQNFGEKAVEEVYLEEEKKQAGEQLQVSLYDSLELDLDLTFPRNFSIRNRRFLDMNIEFTGGLEMIKARNDSLQVFGELKGEKGFVRPLGKNFQLVEGTVTFIGDPENPLLDIRTKYQPPQPNDITIFYIIKGPADNPRFLYESIPEMDKKNILSYTLFGQPFYGIESWKQVVASPEGNNSVVSDLALNVMLDRAESLATQKLGIDVVQIDNSRSGSRSTTTLRTGWYLNEKTFFAVLNELSGGSPETEFLLEYFLKNNLKLILTQGEDNRTGIDISWQYDY